MLRKKITGAKYFSDATKQMTNLNIATPINKEDTNFGSSDILLAKDIIGLTGSANSEDIDKLKTSVQSINEQIINDQKNIAKNAGDISTLNSKFTGLFEVVEVLPDINDAQSGKIYCIKDMSSSEDDNKYIEWVKIKTADDTYKFEKVGEFNAEPDLSNYARLNENTTFNENVTVSKDFTIRWGLIVNVIKKYQNGNKYLSVSDKNDQSSTKTYATNGGLAEIGTGEDFTFTLEDGSTVTKKIRVLSSTTTPAT